MQGSYLNSEMRLEHMLKSSEFRKIWARFDELGQRFPDFKPSASAVMELSPSDRVEMNSLSPLFASITFLFLILDIYHYLLFLTMHLTFLQM